MEIKVPGNPARKMLNYEIRERDYIRSSGIKSIDKLSFYYDRKKKPVPEGKLSTVIYDRKGLVTETLNYNSDNEITSKYSYIYNDSIRVETKKFSPGGELENIYKYEYDYDGYKIKSYRYDLNGNLEKYYTYDYDDSGNLIRDNWFDKSGKMEFIIEHKYDENNKRIETITYDEQDNVVSKYSYRYDDEGNIIEEVKEDTDGTETGFIQYVYSYF
jgi:hypothetical protein